MDETVVQWDNSYSVGVRLVDDQHMELINITNKLFNSCKASQEEVKRAFLETIQEAVDYTGYHFGTEEKIMEKVDFPDMLTHKKEHHDFVREVFGREAELKAGKPIVPLSFANFLKDWVLNHIAVNDKKMGDYLIKMQRNGELHKITLKVRKDEFTDRFIIK